MREKLRLFPDGLARETNSGLAVPSSACVGEGVAADFISACVSFITLLSRLQEEVYSGIGKADARESLNKCITELCH